MKAFIVTVKRKPNSTPKSWQVKAVDADAAKAASERMLKKSGSPQGQVVQVTEKK